MPARLFARITTKKILPIAFFVIALFLTLWMSVTPAFSQTPAVGGGTSDPTTQQQTGPTVITYQEEDPASNSMPSCHPLNGWGPGEGSFVGCIAYIFYYGIYWPISWIAGALGVLFDYFVDFSLSDSSYRADFAVKGWQTVRDICNIFFILILVWTGLMAVFKTDSAQMKRVVPNLIINALLINFSLFATRVVIDASNIVARLFYNSIEVTLKDGTVKKENALGVRPLSEGIMSAFDPQRIFKTELLTNNNTKGSNISGNINSIDTVDTADRNINTNAYATLFIIITIMATIIIAAVGVMFFKTAFFFVARVVGLYIAMVFAPFAFLSRGEMPIVNKVKMLAWDNWIKDLTSYALLAPIFLFFLYIIYAIVKSKFFTIKNDALNGDIIGTIIAIAVPMIIIYFMTSYGVKLAKQYAGAVGDFMQKNLGAAVGTTIGLASGGTALLGRNIIGRGVGVLTKNTEAGKKFSSWAATNSENSAVARLSNNALRASQTGSWDFRNAGIKVGGKERTLGAGMNSAFSYLGTKPVDKLAGNKVAGSLGLTQDAGKGGIKKIDDERKKRKEARIKNSDRFKYDHLSSDEVKAAFQKKKSQAISEAGEKDWKKNIDKDKAVVDSGLLSTLESLEKEEVEITKNLIDSKGSTYEEMYRTQLEDNKKKQEDTDKKLADLRLQTIKDLEQNGKYKESGAYKEAQKGAEERFKEYGDVKDARKLSSVMRAEYAERKLKDSFWVKDGKPKDWTHILTGGTAAAAMATVTGGWGTAFGAAMAMYIQQEGELEIEALKAQIKDHKTTYSKGNRGVKLAATLNELDEKIKGAMNTFYKKKHADVDMYDKTYIEKALMAKGISLDTEINDLENQIRAAAGDDEKRTNLMVEKRMKEKERNDIDKLSDKRDKTKEDLDKHKEAEENKKKQQEAAQEKKNK